MKAICPVLLLSSLSLGCASAPPPSGAGGFGDLLVGEYQALYLKEYDRADWNDWPRYRDMRDALARGERVEPDDLSGRELTPEARGDLAAARARLMRLYDTSAEVLGADAFAGSVGSYECWVEESEEGREPDMIAACEERFERLIVDAEEASRSPFAVLLPSGEPSAIVVEDSTGGVAEISESYAAAVNKPDRAVEVAALDTGAVDRFLADVLAAEPRPARSYLIYFKAGGSEITEESAIALDAALADARETGAARVRVFGHTDTVGSAAVNARLSARRAAAMRDRVVETGLPAASVMARGFGEGDPLIETGDGVDEARNRRVEIVVQ